MCTVNADALKLENVLRVVKLAQPGWGECCVCGRRTRLEWCVTVHNGRWGLVCGDCGLRLQKQLEKVD